MLIKRWNAEAFNVALADMPITFRF